MDNLTEHYENFAAMAQALAAMTPQHADETDAIDAFVFAGQSNMAGRGVAAQAPDASACAFEYRAVTAPATLLPMREPFGVNENRADGINEPHMKTGSLVSALALQYHAASGRRIIGVSAAKGGSAIAQWQPGQPLLQDALSRVNALWAYAKTTHQALGRRALVWCQGETDGDLGTDPAVYQARLITTLQAFAAVGLHDQFLIQIGNHRDDPKRYQPIQAIQQALCAEPNGPHLVANAFAYGAAWDLMKDQFHYRQPMYNLCGQQAGLNIARYYA